MLETPGKGRRREPPGASIGLITLPNPIFVAMTAHRAVAWSVQIDPRFSVGLSFRPVVGLCKEYLEWLND